MAAFALLGAAGAQAQTPPPPTNGNLPKGALPSSWDPTYNVCRGVDPKCYNDWESDENGVTERVNKVLIYSRTAGPRHANIGSSLGPGKNSQALGTFAVTCTTTNTTTTPVVVGNCLNSNNTAQRIIREWLNAEGIAVDITEDVTQLSGSGGGTYKAIIFLSNSRDALWKHGTAIATSTNSSGVVSGAVNTTTNAYLDAAKVNLRKYIQGGGGFVAIHNAFGTEYNWPWYEGLLGNANYYDHGANQLATARVVGSADSSTTGIPTEFTFRDEWYNLVPYPTNVKYLLTVDETTMATRRTSHPGHGNFHPVSWCQYYNGGRSWVTTAGHDTTAFTGTGTATSGVPPEGAAAFKIHLVNGIKSAMGLLPFCTR